MSVNIQRIRILHTIFGNIISHILLSGWTKEEHFTRNLLYSLSILAIHCSFF